jgi:colicin import membrane protein
MTIITAIHVVMVLVLAVQGAIADWLKRKKKPEQVTIIDIRSMPAPQLPVETPATESPPEPPAPEPEPVAPPPKPAASKPTPQKTRPKIEKSKKVVSRTSTPPVTRKPQLTQEEIRRRLGNATPSATTTSTLPSSYYDLVHAALYRAWDQPGGDSVPGGTRAQVTITIHPDGRISNARLTRPSGHLKMDNSVMAAVRSVPKVPSLPTGAGGGPREITVNFQLTGAVL